MTKTNNSTQRCRNYSRKGLDCCYSHRNLEIENPELIIKEAVKNIFDKVIYDHRMDFINEFGWDKYSELLNKGLI